MIIFAKFRISLQRSVLCTVEPEPSLSRPFPFEAVFN